MRPFVREVSVSGGAAVLPEIIRFVEQACDDAGADPAVRFDLTLAVEEACSNVIEHAYGGKGGKFELRYETRDRDVIITLHDHGRPFNPKTVARPDTVAPLENRPIGGLGLHLMYELMDEVRFSFHEHGNTLVMIKRGVVLEGARLAAGDGG